MPRLVRPPVMLIKRAYSHHPLHRWYYQVIVVGPTSVANGHAVDRSYEKSGYAYWHWTAVWRAKWAERTLLAAHNCRVMR